MNESPSSPQSRDIGVNVITGSVKRLLVGLIDAALLFFLNFGLYSLVRITPIASTMNGYQLSMQLIQDEHKLETGYGEVYYLTQDEQQKTYPSYHLYQEEGGEARYYIVRNVVFEDKAKRTAVYNAYAEAVNKDPEYGNASFGYHLHNYLVTAVLCGGVIEVIWFFLIPLIGGRGQTPAMMIGGIRMINSRYYGKPRWYQYLGRTAFIFFVESALPYFILSQYTVLVVPVILALFVIFTPRHRTLHDLVSGVMVIEKSTFSDIVPSGDE